MEIEEVGSPKWRPFSKSCWRWTCVCQKSFHCKRSGGQVCKSIWSNRKMMITNATFRYSEMYLSGFLVLMRNSYRQVMDVSTRTQVTQTLSMP